jgi:hypothetical protein
VVTETRSEFLHRRSLALRAELADAAEKVADEADLFASVLEQAATRGDTARRLGLAALERQISIVERRNAARLRHPGAGPLHLEPLPALIPPSAPPAAGLRSLPAPSQQAPDRSLPPVLPPTS